MKTNFTAAVGTTITVLGIIVMIQGAAIGVLWWKNAHSYSKEEVQKICTNVRVQTQFEDSLAEGARMKQVIEYMEKNR